MGKIFGGICSLSGVLVIALPVPVIVSNFARIYQQSQQTDKKISQQASKTARFEILAKEEQSTFLMGKRLAELQMKAMDTEKAYCEQGNRNNDDESGLKIACEGNVAVTKEDKMPPDHINAVRNRRSPIAKVNGDDEVVVKRGLLSTLHEEMENSMHSSENLSLSRGQLQHYHLLVCLEQIIVS
ncbi:unnamed protein product [Rodentolepis nana]|uniref:DUF3399 domain-containing protein n=1 Tax=Rodentolepis nana TaxID=102285 RepID=A0A0R3U015_RODNA|nr:unnamed protein product [Rodentolepis nana]